MNPFRGAGTPRVVPTKGGSKNRQKLVYPNGYVKYVRYPEQLPKNVMNPMDRQRMEKRQMNTVKQASEILKIARFVMALSEDEYRYDPNHENKPEGSGWQKTDKGWTQNKETQDAQPSQEKNKAQPSQEQTPSKETPSSQQSIPTDSTNAKPTQKSEKGYFSDKERSLPKSVSQPVKDMDGLYKSAEEAQEKMLDWLDKGEGVDKEIGARHYTEYPSDEELSKPGPVLLTAPLKGKKRAQEKVDTDYDGDWSQLTDIVRATIAVDHVDEIDKTMGVLRKSGMKIARKPKDRFAEPTEAGYRDILMNVSFPNGHIGELQVHVKPMLQAKDKAHKLYEQARNIPTKAKEEGRDTMTDEEMNTVMGLNKQMKGIYDDAWKQASGKTASFGFRRRTAAKVIYYEYDDKPAMWEWGKLPIFFRNGKKTTVSDLEKFFREVRVIDRKTFDGMLNEQTEGKESKSEKTARQLLILAKTLMME